MKTAAIGSFEWSGRVARNHIVLPSTILDWIIYPDCLTEFVVLRVVLVSISIFNLLHIRLAKKKLRLYLFSIVFSFTFVFSLMCNISGEGYQSDYYIGIMEVMFGLIPIPFPIKTYTATLTAVCCIYIMTMHCIFPVPFQMRYFIENHTFLIETIIILAFAHMYITSLKNQLKKANKKNEYFAKVFAHDIKNTLFIDAMSLASARKENPDSNAVLQSIETNKYMNRSAGNLINVFSKDEIILKKERTNSGEIFEQFVRDWKGKFENKRIDFQIICSEPITICLDLEYIQLVWDNILSNAYQNTPIEGVVIVKFYSNTGKAVFSFSNSGVLLPKEYQGNLSQKYLSPETHTPYHKGLGLHYSRMMCEFHGGSLEYNVNAEGMNEFVVRLPID